MRDGGGVKLRLNHLADSGYVRGGRHGWWVTAALASTVVLLATLAVRASTVASMAVLVVSEGGGRAK
eukprot:394889-Ditylum_brightwellii.AAC.1